MARYTPVGAQSYYKPAFNFLVSSSGLLSFVWFKILKCITLWGSSLFKFCNNKYLSVPIMKVSHRLIKLTHRYLTRKTIQSFGYRKSNWDSMRNIIPNFIVFWKTILVINLRFCILIWLSYPLCSTLLITTSLMWEGVTWVYIQSNKALG